MNDSTNTQTPRTDAAEQRDITGLGVVPVDFARRLECELQQATQELRDADRGAEALIAACVPGGSICDPQQVADAIREYLRPQEPCGGRCGDPECDLDTNGVTMRAPAPHADTVCHKCGAQIMDPFTGMRQIHDIERCNGKARHD